MYKNGKKLDKKSREPIGRLCYKQQRWNAAIANNKCPNRFGRREFVAAHCAR